MEGLDTVKDDRKLLKEQDPILDSIIKNFISIDDTEKSKSTKLLHSVLMAMVTRMKEADELFSVMYQRIHFAGSWRDGLKIGKPEEFDINVVIKFPVDHSEMKLEPAASDKSYIKIRMDQMLAKLEKLPKWDKYKKIEKWIDSKKYLLQSKFREWMESVFIKAFNQLDASILHGREQDSREAVLELPEGKVKVSHKKSGPALTLKIQAPDSVNFDVDLVPVFELEHPQWPQQERKLTSDCKKREWMIVPKPKKVKEGQKPDEFANREWRTSFQDQETELLNGSGRVKPIIKLLKKLRDPADQKHLSSYAIKTVVMWEMEKQKNNEDFWKKRLSSLFLHLLESLIQCLEKGCIPFYWDKNSNLLSLSPNHQENMCGRLKRVHKDILKGLKNNNKFIIAEKLLTRDELSKFKNEYGLEICKSREESSERSSLSVSQSEILKKFQSENPVTLGELCQETRSFYSEMMAMMHKLMETKSVDRVREYDVVDSPTCWTTGNNQPVTNYDHERIGILEKTVRELRDEIKRSEKRHKEEKEKMDEMHKKEIEELRVDIREAQSFIRCLQGCPLLMEMLGNVQCSTFLQT